jgi:hypothetical protein
MCENDYFDGLQLRHGDVSCARFVLIRRERKFGDIVCYSLTKCYLHGCCGVILVCVDVLFFLFIASVHFGGRDMCL